MFWCHWWEGQQERRSAFYVRAFSAFHRVVVGERGLDAGELEYRARTADENETIPLDGAVEAILEKLA